MGCVKQGKVMGLHTGSQLCQPIRMFFCVGQGQTSQHLLCAQAVWIEPLVWIRTNHATLARDQILPFCCIQKIHS